MKWLPGIVIPPVLLAISAMLYNDGAMREAVLAILKEQGKLTWIDRL